MSLPGVEIHRPESAEQIRSLLAADPERVWILDTETDGLSVVGPDAAHRAHWIGLTPLGSRHCFILSWEEFVCWEIGPILERLRLGGQNLRFDLHALGGIVPTRPWFDSMGTAYFKNTAGFHSLEHLAAVRGWEKIPTPDALKKGRIAEIPHEELFTYLADDCFCTSRLIAAERGNLTPDHELERAVYLMELRGVRVLPEPFEALGQEVEAKEGAARLALSEAGFDGNPNAPEQLKAWLTREGRKIRDTKKQTLTLMAESGDKLAQLIIAYRSVSKLMSGFIRPMPDHLQEDGMIYPHIKTTRTTTGRFAYAEPNIQQIPKRTALGKRLRHAITDRDRTGVIASDYSQVELRVVAAFADEPVLLSAFREGRCPHRSTAASMLRRPIEEVTDEDRFNAKAVNFGILNGMGSKGLAYQLRSTRSEAARFLRAYKEGLPKLNEWMEGCWGRAESVGMARTVAGRTRIYRAREKTRTSISVEVQGSAAELLRAAVCEVERKGLGAIGMVHDEILAPRGAPDEAEGRTKLLQGTMESAANEAYADSFEAVNFAAEAGAGETWGDAG